MKDTRAFLGLAMPKIHNFAHLFKREAQSFKAAFVATLILLGVAQTSHANMVLELDASHFKVEVFSLSDGSGSSHKARLTFMNTHMNTIRSMVGVLHLRTDVLSSAVVSQAFVSTMETVNFKVSVSSDAPYTTELLFVLSSNPGQASTEITLEWFFNATPGFAITLAEAMVDGIVAVEILEGCKTHTPTAIPDWQGGEHEAWSGGEPQMPGLLPAVDAEVSAYPNPAGNTLHLQHRVPALLPGRVRICTTTGQVVLEQAVDGMQLHLDLSALAPGTYLVHGVLNGCVVYTRRIQKR